MGQLRFVTPQRDRLPPGAVEQAYLTGMEGVPFPSHNFWDGDQIVLERDVRESGNFHILWNVPQRGPLLLSTASLMERSRAYLLPVELARGTLNRVRNQNASWQTMGLTASAKFQQEQHAALDLLAQAATHQGNPTQAAAFAEQSLAKSLEALDTLCGAYTSQVLGMRHEQSPQLATLSACGLPAQQLSDAGAKLFQSAFNAACVPLVWRAIEPVEGDFRWTNVDKHFQWLKQRGLKVLAGPLLRLDTLSLPDWLYLWDDDFEVVQGYVHNFLTKTVERYRGQVQVWHCAAGLNLPGGLALSEEQKLRLAVLAIDTVRRTDSRTPIIISFDQPWGEYLQREELDLPPYHFADALVRADLGVSGVGVELNIGYSPGGTLPRDVLELSRLIDRWSTLGVPLVALLSSPSSAIDDAQARSKAAVITPGVTANSQAAWLKPWLEMLVAKQCIHGLVWNQLFDSESHVWPNSGLLVDAAGQTKPLFSVFSDLKKQHLV